MAEKTIFFICRNFSGYNLFRRKAGTGNTARATFLLPPETRYSIHNSINSFSFYAVHGADSKNIHDIVPMDFYLPYKIEKLPESSQLVVLIMGESTSADKMHLFNPNARPTTPQLDKMKDEKGFAYSLAISGAVSTHSSLPIFSI